MMTPSTTTTTTTTSTTNSRQDVDQIVTWCINVQAVGGGFGDFHLSADDDDEMADKSSTVSGPRFAVTVSPENGTDTLHQEIEGVTGVKASQQRLIYRGRLIGKNEVSLTSPNNNNENNNIGNDGDDNNNDSKTSVCQQAYKIKDITGLCDGHTIHLVKKRETENVEVDEQDTSSGLSPPDSNTATASNIEDSFTESEVLNGSRSGNGGSALLAALLGLGGLDSGNNNTDRSTTTAAATTATVSPTISPWRSSRVGTGTSSGLTHRNRRLPYRLVGEDLEVPDPGSMEPVRQGLMTLHTIMNSQQNVVEEGRYHPLQADREFFRGQWIDARDTVNQWLEATVVDILDPQDVLNDVVLRNQPTTTVSAATSLRTSLRQQQQQQQRRVYNVNDPVISANDTEGRRSLLIEECESGDPQEILVGNSVNDDEISPQSSFRPRPSNNGAKLLLIHYNGWPHRWDEWIRSDNERLRPFRTRTRHSNMSSIASPTLQSIFAEAPRTNIRDGDEEEDRLALLPELNVALSQVSELFGKLVHREHDENNNQNGDEDDLEDLRPLTNNTSGRAKKDLPWMAKDVDYGEDSAKIKSEDNRNSSVQCNIVGPNEGDEQEHKKDDKAELSSEQVPPSFGRDAKTMYSQRELRNVSTLFDRLGRILTASAPHIASLAASLPEEINTSSDQLASNSSEHVNHPEFDTPSPAPLGGLLSLWSRERRRHNGNQESASTRPRTATSTIDPDHVDFSSGIVNTTRGEVRSGPRSRTSHDDVANLLGTYLAAASLGSATIGSDDDNGVSASAGADNSTGLARLLSRGSSGVSGDNGIDIHIHAIVTAPGASPGGMSIATIGSGGRSPTANLGGARNSISSNWSSTQAGGGGAIRGNSLSSTNVNPMDEEDYTDLFSELYSENPSPIDPNGSLVPGREESHMSGNSQATVNSPTRSQNGNGNEGANNYSSTMLNDEHGLSGDQSLRTSGGRNRSSPRRQSADRRSGVLRGLFRRRGSRNNNGHNEET